jgi:hypothetical protein
VEVWRIGLRSERREKGQRRKRERRTREEKKKQGEDGPKEEKEAYPSLVAGARAGSARGVPRAGMRK